MSGAKGAERETTFPPFGDQALRQVWAARAAALPTLGEAVAALVHWRAEQTAGAVVTGDARWIEARLEDRAAVLRFEELPQAQIRSHALTGERIEDVAASFEERVRGASAGALEALAAELRLRWKPRILPSSPYLRLETWLSEHLMKTRSRDWFGPSLAQLRARRVVKVLKEGLTY
jgi:methane monooxygenase component A gamma chain